MNTMILKTDHLLFEQEISSRGIDCLVHFTPTINLLSMVTEGFVFSRAKIESLGIAQTDILDYVNFTDQIRYDDKRYINLSVQSPNHYLFSRFRERTKQLPHIRWCVLKIHTKYIYAEGTLFSVTNAASNCAKRDYGITGDLDKFKTLFRDPLPISTSSGSRTLHRAGLPLKYPTDVQAEILVIDDIDVHDILSICFENEDDLAATKAAIDNANHSIFKVDPISFTSQRS